MASQTSQKPLINFSGGLFTESTALTTPEGVLLDALNLNLKTDFSIEPRNGLDYESGYVFSDAYTADQVGGAISTHLWDNVANLGDLRFAVVQVGNVIRFYDVSGSSISTGIQTAFSIDLDTYLAPGSTTTYQNEIDVSSGKGYLFITHPDIEPLYVSYDPDTALIAVNPVTIEIRDLDGLDDGLAVDEQPLTLSSEHRYNLRNQGWVQPSASYLVGGTGDPIQIYFNSKAIYPSNSQQWWQAKDISNLFSPNDLDKLFFGNTRAPRGHYIINPFRIDRSAVSGIAGFPVIEESRRPTTSAFYAGRIFWGGVDDTIYFSKIIEGDSDFGKCYQEADPTSEQISDLIDSDGGTIKIQGGGQVVKLQVFANVILVYTTNGVWAIGSSTSFKATDYFVKQLSKVRLTGKGSIVNTESNPFFWGDTGIFSVSINEVSELPVIQNISDQKIRDYYLTTIPEAAKPNVTSAYDRAEKKIVWLYSNSATPYRYDRILELALKTGGFYPKAVNVATDGDGYVHYIGGVIETPRINLNSAQGIVTVEGETVTAGGATVTTSDIVLSGSGTFLRYLLVAQNGTNSYRITFGDFDNRNMVDWETEGLSQTYEAYGVSPHQFGNSFSTFKTPVYVVAFFNRTETAFVLSGGAYTFDFPSSCLLQTQWDFADSSASNKFGQEQEIYRFVRPFLVDVSDLTFNYGHDVIVTKTKVKGRGRSMQLKFAKNGNKTFNLLGFDVKIKSTTNI